KRSSHLARTQRPVRYYLIDFRISRNYPPDVRIPLEPILVGGDKSAPEFRAKDGEILEVCDPFPTDVYYIGNLIRKDFVQVIIHHLVCSIILYNLMADMVQNNPALRPTLDEMVRRFDDIVRGLSRRKLRSRLRKAYDPLDFYYATTHWFRKIVHIITRRPPIPTP
ncbi:hypothetical protein FB451DRAFT_1065361, partial [Mycena latifolia]